MEESSSDLDETSSGVVAELVNDREVRHKKIDCHETGRRSRGRGLSRGRLRHDSSEMGTALTTPLLVGAGRSLKVLGFSANQRHAFLKVCAGASHLLYPMYAPYIKPSGMGQATLLID